MATKKSVVTKPAEVVKTTTPVQQESSKVKRTYSDDSKIPCMSITPGEYLHEGAKSKTVYSWIDAGVTEDMRYDDLTSAIRTKRPCIFKPRIVIQDDEFLKDYPELQRLYDSLYSKDDLTEILKLEANEMARVIDKLPDGAKESLKTMAMIAINNGTLDSVARVRMLDQIYHTDMLLKLAQ